MTDVFFGRAFAMELTIVPVNIKYRYLKKTYNILYHTYNIL